MRILVEPSRLVLLTCLLFTIGVYLAIDQPASRQPAMTLTQSTQPQLALTQVTFTKSGRY